MRGWSYNVLYVYRRTTNDNDDDDDDDRGCSGPSGAELSMRVGWLSLDIAGEPGEIQKFLNEFYHCGRSIGQ